MIIFLTGIEVILIQEIVNISINNDLAIKGIELYETIRLIEKFKIQNNILRNEILDNTALTNINYKARTAGFVDAKYFYFYDK